MYKQLFIGVLAALLSLPLIAVLMTRHSQASDAPPPPALRSDVRARGNVPDRLTLAQKAMVTGKAVVDPTAYLDLTPSAPTAERGHLVLASTILLTTGRDAVMVPESDGFVETPDAATPHVSLHFVPDPAQNLYLVDCRADGAQKFFVRVWPGASYRTFGAGQHVLLTLSLTQGARDEVHVALSAKSEVAGQGWTFYGCDVTRL